MRAEVRWARMRAVRALPTAALQTGSSEAAHARGNAPGAQAPSPGAKRFG